MISSQKKTQEPKRIAKKFDLQQESEKDELSKFTGKILQKKKQIPQDEDIPDEYQHILQTFKTEKQKDFFKELLQREKQTILTFNFESKTGEQYQKCLVLDKYGNEAFKHVYQI